MTETKTYNGWANYETWCVNLWLTNEEGSDSYWRDAAQEAWDDTDEDESAEERSEAARIALSDRLKDEITDGAPDIGASLWSDLITSALSEVVWYDIADGFLEDAEGYQSTPAQS